MRALIVTRLSRMSEVSTSIDRQTEICEDFCRQRGWEVIGAATDTDVSGSVDPFDRKKRPELAAWLHGERERFDVLVTYRADRLTRNVRNLQSLVAYAEDHGFVIVSATEPHFDLSSPFAAVLVALIGMIAEWELNAISERNASTRKRDRKLGKYTGSTPPWGYVAQRVNGEWRLVPDPEQVAVINEVVRRLLDAEPLQKIALDLTARGIPTVKDRLRVKRGEAAQGTEWSVTPMKRALTSEAMLGYVMSGGKPLRNDDGSPIVRSEGILSREVFDRVGEALESRSVKGGRTPAAQSLLTGVLRCGVCGEPAYRFNGGSHSTSPRYRCRSMNKGKACGNRTVKVSEVDDRLEATLLGLFGPFERRMRVWSEGSDHSAELGEVNATLADLTSQLGSGAFTAGTPQRAVLDERIAVLAARQAELSAQAVKPAGWEWIGTGEMFGVWWQGLNIEAKNNYLRSMGVTVLFDRDSVDPRFGDLLAMLGGLDADALASQFQQITEFATEFGIAGYEVSEDTVTLVSQSGERWSVAVD